MNFSTHRTIRPERIATVIGLILVIVAMGWYATPSPTTHAMVVRPEMIRPVGIPLSKTIPSEPSTTFIPATRLFRDRIIPGVEAITGIHGKNSRDAGLPPTSSIMSPRNGGIDHTFLNLFFAQSYDDGVWLSTGGLELWAHPIAATEAALSEQDGRLVYRGAYHRTDVVHVITPGRSEEFLHLEDASAPTHFDYELSPAAGTLQVVEEQGGLLISDTLGRRVQIEAPWVIDAHGQRSDSAVKWLVARNDAQSSIRITLTLDPTGLVYPLVIDPTWKTVGELDSFRRLHTATLLTTGKVLVAGGEGVAGVCKLYDPQSGTWTATGSLTDGRCIHAAVLLRNGKVLAVGGFGNGGSGPTLASCELYDPATGTWNATGSLNTGRYWGVLTVLQSGKVLIAGGVGGNDNSTYLTTCELYDPATGKWTYTGSLANTRIGHTLTLLPSGKVLASGAAYGGAGLNPLSACELYDPALGTWSATGGMALTRGNHAAMLLNTGKVLVAGGAGDSGASTTCELYNPADGTWSVTGGLAETRSGFPTLTMLPNGKVLIAGGGIESSPLATCEIYDPTAGTWSATVSMNEPRIYHTATLLPTGQILMAGGWVWPATSEIYDATAPTWSAASAMASARTQHSATLLHSGKVLVVGGLPDTSGSDPLASCVLYDPQANTWAATGSLSAPRLGHAATVLASGKVLVSGGYNDIANGLVTTCELFDPTTGTWSATGSMNVARGSSPRTLLPSGKVLAYGGPDLTSCELYDPTTGTWTATGSMGTPRSAFTATLLPTGKVLVAGGYGSGVTFWDTQQASCELFDPQTGTWSDTGSLAMPRDLHGAVLLSSGRVLVVGGRYAGWARTLTTEIYDPMSGTWTTSGSINEGRESPNAVLLHSGSVLVTSGYSAIDISELATVSSERFDPMTGTWTLEPGTVLPRRGPTTTLLANGKVLETGGIYNYNVLSSCRLYDVGLTYSTADRPTITSLAASRPYASKITLTGTLFTGRSEGSSGSTSSSPTNHPLVRIRSATSGQEQWLPCDPTGSFSATSVTTSPVTGFTPGPAFIEVIVNGIPSVAKPITITRVDPTITWATPSAITYGTLLAAGKLNASANVPGTFVYQPAAGTKLAAGTQTLTVTFTPTDGVGYATVSKSVSLTVNKASLSVTANDASRVYGAANPAFTGTVTGVVAGDAITSTYASTATATTTVGVYGPATAQAITPTLLDPGSKLANYNVTSTNGTLTITPAVLTITAVNSTKVVGKPVPTLTALATGLIAPDTLETLDTPPSISTTATKSSPTGTYPITVSGAVDADYTITMVDGTLTVTESSGGSGGGGGGGGGGNCGLGSGIAALASAVMLLLRFRLVRREERHPY